MVARAYIVSLSVNQNAAQITRLTRNAVNKFREEKWGLTHLFWNLCLKQKENSNGCFGQT